MMTLDKEDCKRVLNKAADETGVRHWPFPQMAGRTFLYYLVTRVGSGDCVT